MPPVVASHTVTRFEAATSVTATLPAGTVADDLLVAVVESDTAADTATGWNLVAKDVNTTTGLAIFWRAATGGDPTTFTRTGTRTYQSVIVLRVTDADLVAPDIGAFVKAFNADIAAATVTPTNADHLLLGTWGAEGSSAVWTPPAGMVELVEDQRLMVATEQHTGTDPVSRDASHSSMIGYQIGALMSVNPAPPVKAKGNSKTDFAADSLTVTATLPAGTAVDDILVAFVVADDPPAAADGWQLLARQDHLNIGLSVFWRIATGDDPLTFSRGTTKTGEEVIIVTVEGARSAAPEIGSIATGSGTSTAIAASVTPTSEEHLLLGVYGSETAAATWTPPAGMAENLDSGGTEIATEYRVGSGAVSREAVCTALVDQKIAALVALAPPPDAPTTHYFDGSIWSTGKPLMRFDGAAWSEKVRTVQ